MLNTGFKLRTARSDEGNGRSGGDLPVGQEKPPWGDERPYIFKRARVLYPPGSPVGEPPPFRQGGLCAEFPAKPPSKRMSS